MKAGKEFGCSAAWILTGQTAAGWMDSQTVIAGSTRGLEAHILSQAREPNVLPRIAWENVVDSELPYLFEVVMPDDSMQPWILRGDVVGFKREGSALPSDVVLVRDRDGRAYVRMHQPRSADEWLARPINDAYGALDSTRDGLSLLGVLVSLTRRR